MEWWKGAVIYQVYPRSFCDSNNDGIGDLQGLTSKLEYLNWLGVDGLWVSPFFKSPMKDFGYDVSDYREIDPIFGSMEDFDSMLAKTHDLNLKLIIDQVYNHTSDQHEWFKESRSSKDNPKADWYVWAPARPDGGPPNNWISLFGGQAWSWDSRRRQYYLHNFLMEQPDLNFHNPAVREEILDTATFWLDKGIDGFRLDVANFYFHDQKLRNNPPKNYGEHERPYWHQRHLYDRSQPETLQFMETFRTLLDTYQDIMSVAEIGSDDYIGRCIEYTEPGRLHTAYNFFLLENGPFSAGLIRKALEDWTSQTSWPSWSFSNHDVVRSRTRWGGVDASDEFATLLMAILMCLRGTIFLYQGEELGLPQGDVPFDKLQDPEGIRFWPDSLGRDGGRTPIPWQAGKANSGFSDTEPWLPVDPAHDPLAVDRQQATPESILHAVRDFIAFRKASPALKWGSIRFLDLGEPLLGFVREYEGETLCCLYNLSENAQKFEIHENFTQIASSHHRGTCNASSLDLPAYGFIILTR